MNKHHIIRYQQSILDFLLDTLDHEGIKRQNHNKVSSSSADMLFNIWKDINNKVSNHIYRRPVTISQEDVKIMQKEGLVKDLGNKVEITDKGGSVIKTIILGDDRSSFAKAKSNHKDISYIEALLNVKSRSIKQSNNKNELSWWNRVL